MLGILLTILKILGIILLSALLLIILILCVLLFVPVRYSFRGKLENEYFITGKVTWLCSLLYVPITLDEKGLHTDFRILGFKPGRRKKKKKRNIQQTEQENKQKTERRVETKVETKIEEKIEEKIEQDESIFYKIYEKIYHRVTKIINLIQEKIKGLKQLNAKKNQILDFFCEQESVESKEKTIKIVKKALHHIMPYRLEAYIKFGLEYPDETGKVYAVLTTLYGVYGKHLELVPDFENKVLEGNFKLKGRIRLLNVIYYAIYLYRIKKLKEFISLLK